MDAKEFEHKTGYYPKHDDLERVNCEKAGKVGHWMCGWCKKCDLPVFQCPCENPVRL